MLFRYFEIIHLLHTLLYKTKWFYTCPLLYPNHLYLHLTAAHTTNDIFLKLGQLTILLHKQ